MKGWNDMKRQLMILSAILLVAMMVAGGTMAWFTSSLEAEATHLKIGIVKVEVIDNSLENIKIRSLGTLDSYIRVKIIPQWSDSSIPISDIKIDINDSDWKYKDGYYYYKHIVKEGEETSRIINTINSDLTHAYEGATFTIKIVAEGVQSTHEAWKDIWSINSLPF